MTARSNRGGFADYLAKAPAPGQYNVPPPESTKNKAPAYTMQSRTFMPSGLFVLVSFVSFADPFPKM